MTFVELYDQEEEPIRLGVYESTPGLAEIDEYVWDTTVAELEAPWPHHMPDDLDLRGMVSWLSGRNDVTGFLYDMQELERYERGLDDTTALMEVVMQ